MRAEMSSIFYMKTFQDMINNTDMEMSDFSINWDQQFDQHPLISKFVETFGYLSIHKDAANAIVHSYISAALTQNQYYVYTKREGYLNPGLMTLVLAPSSVGKGAVESAIERIVLKDYYDTYMEVHKSKFDAAAQRWADQANAPFEQGVEKLEKLGIPLIWCKTLTQPTFDQMKTLFGVTQFGALHYIVDEIFSRPEILKEGVIQDFVEAFESGMSKPRGLKNTKENERIAFSGQINSSVLMFGTGTKLKTDPSIKQLMNAMGEEGWARRVAVIYQDKRPIRAIKTPKEREVDDDGKEKELYGNQLNQIILKALKMKGFKVEPDERAYQLLREYSTLRDYRESEEPILNRSYAVNGTVTKVLKVAGMYAVLDNKPFIDETSFLMAVRYVEDTMKYIETVYPPQEIHLQVLSFLKDNTGVGYPSTTLKNGILKGISAKGQEDALLMAQDAARLEGSVLSVYEMNGVEMYKAISMPKAQTCVMSGTTKEGAVVNTEFLFVDIFDELNKYDTVINHQVVNASLDDQNIMEGFSMLILEIGETDLGWERKGIAKILKDYTHATYKITIPEVDEDGVIHGERDATVLLLPLSNIMKLNSEQYYDYMLNVRQILPFGSGIEVQTPNYQISADIVDDSLVIHEGKIFDGLTFLYSQDSVMKGVNISQFNEIELWYFSLIEKNGARKILSGYFNIMQGLLDKDQAIIYLKDFNQKLAQHGVSNSIIDSITK